MITARAAAALLGLSVRAVYAIPDGQLPRYRVGAGRGGPSLRAHRIAAALHLPEFSDDMVVRHDCDNPACVNPHHLRMGTQAENIADREARGRGNHAAKLPNIMRIAEARRRRNSPHTA